MARLLAKKLSAARDSLSPLIRMVVTRSLEGYAQMNLLTSGGIRAWSMAIPAPQGVTPHPLADCEPNFRNGYANAGGHKIPLLFNHLVM